LESGRLQPLALLLAGEFLLVLCRDALNRSISLVDSLLGERHSNRASLDLMRHAAALDLTHFEQSEYQDRLERARRQAASRSTVLAQVFSQGQMAITAVSFAIGLVLYAPFLIVLLLVALLPAVWGEFRFNRLSYWLNHKRSPER